jgi:hypothetical protein
VDGQALRRKYIETMLERADDSRFPSNDLLDRIEATLVTEDELAEYGDILVKKLDGTQFPSGDLLRRLEALVSRFAVENGSSESGG